MRPFFQSVSNLRQRPELLRRRRYGVIEMWDGLLAGIHVRPFPKIVSVAEVWWSGRRMHHQRPGDRCLLYYNQPRSCSGFLSLPYIVSHRDTSLKTLRGALVVLDEIARLKESLAAVCEISNLRISDRLLRRWGWEAHVPDSARRHFIKRFYGEFPDPAAAWALEAA